MLYVLGYAYNKYNVGLSARAPPRILSDMKKKNPHAVALAKLGAAKGGKARAANMTPKARRAAAIKAVNARWKKG